MKSLNYLLILGLITCISCSESWLDAKPNKSLVVPNKAADYQALLDNTTKYNNDVLGLAELATDDYEVTYQVWQNAQNIERNSYIWASDPYEGASVGDWIFPYERVLQDNIVLEGLSRIEHVNEEFNNAKGTALFYRAFDFFALAQQFCKPFDTVTASSDLGIPLRLTANVNDMSFRSTVSETYARIIDDLKTAKSLLPLAPMYKTRPSVPAAYAMLARVYLSMEDYENAQLYADSCLQLYDYLIDYNDVNTSAARPFPRFNDETIFHWRMTNFFLSARNTVSPELLQSYEEGDLRKQGYFTATNVFKGSYDGSAVLFNGLATDEIILIRAECRARGDDIDGAMNDLNTLLKTRWSNDVAYPTHTAENADDALTQVLFERRKELCFRGVRWSDLRRLNKDPRFAKPLTRELNGEFYTLQPDDLRYVFPIPDNEILSSGIEQNPRN